MHTWRDNLAALTWATSGILVMFYAFLGLIGKNIPGISYLVNLLSNLDSNAIYIALVLAMLIEGIYIIGNFFPGSSIIVLLVIGKTTQDISIFLTAIAFVFMAWLLAGLINTMIGLLIKKSFLDVSPKQNVVSSNKWITWFPAFRANYEVSQVIEGHSWWQVFLVSSRIKLITSFFMVLVLYILSLIIDINEVDNKEGFISLIIVALISIFIGYIKYIQESRE